MRFLRRETALSGLSLCLTFTVNMVLFLVNDMCVNECSCRAVALFRLSSTRVLYHGLSGLSSGPSSQVPGSSGEAPGCRVRSGVPFRPFLVALWFVLGGVWMLGGCAAAH